MSYLTSRIRYIGLSCGHFSQRCINNGYYLLAEKDTQKYSANRRRTVETLSPERRDPIEVEDNKKRPMMEMFSFFKVDVLDVQSKLVQPWDMTLRGVANYFKKRQTEAILEDQGYDDIRLKTLGPNLAAATFVIDRGGCVKFRGKNYWSKMDENGKINDLPTDYSQDYIIEELDLGKQIFVYEGLDNLEMLQSLRAISFADSPSCDDFILDSIVGRFSKTLEKLNLSRCEGITFKGLAGLSRLRKLKELTIEGMEKMANVQLICVLLEDAIPGLKIKGISLDVRFEKKGAKDVEDIKSEENNAKSSSDSSTKENVKVGMKT